MTIKIQEIKKHVEAGHLELATLDENNQPVKMQISQLQKKAQQINKNQQIYKLVSKLSWQEKFQWVNTRRLKGNQYFKNGDIQKAIQTYIQSLIGLQLKDTNQQRNAQVKLELQFPILMNIATCFYKLRQYKKGVQICDQILNDPQGQDHAQALYKKAYFLFELGQFLKSKQDIFDKVREILIELNVKLDKFSTVKKVSKQDVRQLLAKILTKTKEQKTMYCKIFYQQDDQMKRENYQQNKQPPILVYNQGLIKKSIIWLRQTLQSCYRHKSSSYIEIEEQQKSKLLLKREK